MLSGLDAVYNIDSLSNDDLLKYNYRELLSLAARGNAKQREWLRNYLNACDGSVEKHSLPKALEGMQP